MGPGGWGAGPGASRGRMGAGEGPARGPHDGDSGDTHRRRPRSNARAPMRRGGGLGLAWLFVEAEGPPGSWRVIHTVRMTVPRPHHPKTSRAQGQRAPLFPTSRQHQTKEGPARTPGPRQARCAAGACWPWRPWPASPGPPAPASRTTRCAPETAGPRPRRRAPGPRREGGGCGGGGQQGARRWNRGAAWVWSGCVARRRGRQEAGG